MPRTSTMMEWVAAPEDWLSRLVIQRGLAAVYLIAFLVAVNQFRPLLGERGLLPAPGVLVTRGGRAAGPLAASPAPPTLFPPLRGGRGLLPAPGLLRAQPFRESPSLSHWRYSDRLFQVVAWTGVLVAALALTGVTETG